ncbi:MAG: response regulator, partial [Lachnospiraceae bacterium]|nr:response regulator [Lachnospiraceae bacterium]
MLRILLVEDEYLVLKGMEMLLKTQEEVELTVRTAMDAGKALDETEDWKPDVVISDINMPEMDGLTLLERIAEIYPQCKFIVISGYDEHDYMKRALKLHVHDYLLKPVDKVYLFRRLAQFDREKRQRLDNALMRLELLLIKRQELNAVE